MATSLTPSIKSSWQKRGILFPQLSWSKSGSILLRENQKSYMIFGDSSLVPGFNYFSSFLFFNKLIKNKGVQLAESDDLLNWNLIPGVFIPVFFYFIYSNNLQLFRQEKILLIQLLLKGVIMKIFQSFEY